MFNKCYKYDTVYYVQSAKNKNCCTFISSDIHSILARNLKRRLCMFYVISSWQRWWQQPFGM